MDDLVNISIENAGLIAVLGYLVVFLGLVLLMVVIMIMAIVADTLGKPLNELRFKSIREVKDDEI